MRENDLNLGRQGFCLLPVHGMTMFSGTLHSLANVASSGRPYLSSLSFLLQERHGRANEGLAIVISKSTPLPMST